MAVLPELFVAQAGPVPLPLVPAIAELTLVVVFVVALGLTIGAMHIADAFFGVAGGLIGKIPIAGGWAEGKIEKVGQRINSRLGLLAVKLERGVGRSWHAAAGMIDWTFDIMWDTAKTVAHLGWYIESRMPVPLLIAKVAHLLQRLREAEGEAAAAVRRIRTVERVIYKPAEGVIGAGVKTLTKPLRIDIAGLRARVRALERTITRTVAVELPGQIAGAREAAEAARRALGRLWERVRRHERALVGLGAAALVLTALQRIGATWLRCSNWRKAGRAVCRMDTDGLDLLLAGTLVIVGGISIRELAYALQAVTGEVVDEVHGFIREA